ncbi:hypothetical protein CBER1_07465 [Cercospora berteroae]|uniref:Uncharacterized protein n=1 Tax=Cercospora berteroae TaxID=357750 RepID=A0A2S6BTH3_9PEZI|nr:hypothetical protein CBER1_07465 [Cercospora berteroae]
MRLSFRLCKNTTLVLLPLAVMRNTIRSATPQDPTRTPPGAWARSNTIVPRTPRIQAQVTRFHQPGPLPNNQTYARAPGGGYAHLAYVQQLPETQAYTANYRQQFRELPNQADPSWVTPQTLENTIPTDSFDLQHDDSSPQLTTRRSTRISSSIKHTQASPLAQASTPTKVVRRTTNEDRITRKPVPPRKGKIVKDMSSLINYMDDNEAMALIQRRAGTGDPNAPQYLNQINSKQDALDHLACVDAPAISFILPAALLIAPGQFSVSDKSRSQEFDRQ